MTTRSGTRARRGRPDPRTTPRSGSFAPLRPAPVPRPTGGTQETLFGPAPAPVEQPERRADRLTADAEDIATVLRLALDPGYLLVGVAERVARHAPDARDTAQPVPRHEAEVVGQLLDSGHLTTGAPLTVTYAGRSGPARTVLVPARARRLLDRWRATHVTHT